MREKENITLLTIQENSENYRFIGENLKTDFNFIKKALRVNAWRIEYTRKISK